LLAAFFVPLDFFGPLLRAFFAGAAVLDVAAGAAAAAVDAGAGLAALDFALPLDFDAPAAFFFGAARFFGLLALPPAAFGLAVRAFVAFFAPVDAFFLAAVAAGAGAGEAAFAAGAVAVPAAGAAVAVAGFFAAFFGEAERFRLVPVADFGLLDERAFFAGLAPPAAFGRLRDLAGAFFVVAFFTLPADEPLAFFGDFFFPPARAAGLAVAGLTLVLADVVCVVLGAVVPLGSAILFYLRSECVYEY